MNAGGTPRPLGLNAPPKDGTEAEPTRRPLWNRQIPLLLLVAATLLFALAVSPLLSGFLWPVFWSYPFYINPIITLALLLFVGIGLVTSSSPNDQGWPFYLGLIGLWIFIVGFEFSIVQWLELQLGVRTIAARVHPIVYTACAVAVGAGLLLHGNQLARRLHTDLHERGLDPEELELLEQESSREARTIVINLVVLVGIASVILWIADFLLGSTRLGLDVLGILAGLLIVSVILAYSYSILKQGPAAPSESGSPPTSPGSPAPPPTNVPRSSSRTTQALPRKSPTTQTGADEERDVASGSEPEPPESESEDGPDATWRRV